MKTVVLFVPSLGSPATWTADRDYVLEQVQINGNLMLTKDGSFTAPAGGGEILPPYLAIAYNPLSGSSGVNCPAIDVRVPVLSGETIYAVAVATTNNKSANLVLSDLTPPTDASIEPDG